MKERMKTKAPLASIIFFVLLSGFGLTIIASRKRRKKRETSFVVARAKKMV